MSKLLRRSLSVVEPPIPLGGGRIVTAAGELAQVVNGETFRFLAVVEFRYSGPESPARGNHVHRRKTETLYVVRGMLRATYEDLETGEKLTMNLGPGDLVTVPPDCAHAYVPLAEALAIEFSDKPYDPSDTEPHRVEVVG